ncbi:MAG TPA: GNAT family N-acetyltransferase [Candidatus Hydrogenedentes bacterium]|nr:GNAT family N-acetyltransferase [Candidatus Hydrogenedentota bacterium]
MKVEIHNDLQGFSDLVRPLLLQNEAENNVMLGMLHRRLVALKDGVTIDAEEPFLCSISNQNRIIGAGMQTPPYGLNLTKLPPDAIDPFVDALSRHSVHLHGVHSTSETAASFATAWTRRQNVSIARSNRLLLYKLNRLCAPKACPGFARLATAADVELLWKWELAFANELDMFASDNTSEVQRKVAQKSFYVWQTDEPVAKAGYRVISGACARIVDVYVPHQYRRRGFASAVAHAIADHLQCLGYSTVFLFTVAEDVGPNVVYSRLGFETLGEFTDYRFADTQERA